VAVKPLMRIPAGHRVRAAVRYALMV
jgi:hypothetical protein